MFLHLHDNKYITNTIFAMPILELLGGSVYCILYLGAEIFFFCFPYDPLNRVSSWMAWVKSEGTSAHVSSII